MYSRGRGVGKDESQAAELYLKGAMLEHVPSQVEVARRYLTGEGIRLDPVESFAWYDLAAKAGDASAVTTLAGMSRQLSSAQSSAGRSRSAELRREIETRKASFLRP
jgi:TPR repeat protein